jgi:hypothetical protein
MMRTWIEVPGGWGWGAVQELKGWLGRAGYDAGEYRVAGHVMLAVAGAPPVPGGPPAWPPDWREDSGPAGISP